MSSHAPQPPAIIVFDGVCVLCAGWTRFVLRFDHRQRFQLAAMQTNTGARILAAEGLDPADPSTFVVLDLGRSYRDSDALIHVLRHCGIGWRGIAGLLRWLPRRWRDAAYRYIARNRYRWFGQRDVCVMPDPRHRHRFLQ